MKSIGLGKLGIFTALAGVLAAAAFFFTKKEEAQKQSTDSHKYDDIFGV